MDNPRLHVRIKQLLETITADAANSHMATILRTYFDNTVEESVKIIAAMLQGLGEGPVGQAK